MIPGVRVIYTREGDLWWAYADLHLSAAGESLPDLKDRVRNTLREIFGPSVPLTEITDRAVDDNDNAR